MLHSIPSCKVWLVVAAPQCTCWTNLSQNNLHKSIRMGILAFGSTQLKVGSADPLRLFFHNTWRTICWVVAWRLGFIQAFVTPLASIVSLRLPNSIHSTLPELNKIGSNLVFLTFWFAKTVWRGGERGRGKGRGRRGEGREEGREGESGL